MVNDRQSLDLTTFARPAGGGDVEWRISAAPGALSRGRGRDGGPRRPISPTARRPSWCGCWSIPRSTPPAPAARQATCSIPAFPMFATGRGGQLTYHGPGQRVAYVMLDLKRRRPDVRAYVAGLEEWIIRTLAAFNVRGERREDRVGVWVKRPDKGAGYEDKIAAIGVRLRRWVSFHGIAINVEPELVAFRRRSCPAASPIPRYGVTSLVDLGLPVTMADVDVALRQAFAEVFGAANMRACRKRRLRSLTPPHAAARLRACRRCSAAPGSGRQSRRRRPSLRRHAHSFPRAAARAVRPCA